MKLYYILLTYVVWLFIPYSTQADNSELILRVYPSPLNTVEIPQDYADGFIGMNGPHLISNVTEKIFKDYCGTCGITFPDGAYLKTGRFDNIVFHFNTEVNQDLFQRCFFPTIYYQPQSIQLDILIVDFSIKDIEHISRNNNQIFPSRDDILKLWQDGKGTCLHTLKGVATSHSETRTEAVEEVTYGTDISTFSSNGIIVPQAFSTRKVGTTTTFTPFSTLEMKSVFIDLSIEITSLLKTIETPITKLIDGNKLNATITQPIFYSQSINTWLSMQDQTTLVLGGMMNPEHTAFTYALITTSIIGTKTNQIDPNYNTPTNFTHNPDFEVYTYRISGEILSYIIGESIGYDFDESNELDESEKANTMNDCIKQFLCKVGIPFPEGSHVRLDPYTQELMLYNSKENLQLFKDIFDWCSYIPPQTQIDALFVEFDRKDIEQLILKDSTSNPTDDDLIQLWKDGKGTLINAFKTISKSETTKIKTIQEYIFTDGFHPHSLTNALKPGDPLPIHFKTQKAGTILSYTAETCRDDHAIDINLNSEISTVSEQDTAEMSATGTNKSQIGFPHQQTNLFSQNFSTHMALEDQSILVISGISNHDNTKITYLFLTPTIIYANGIPRK